MDVGLKIEGRDDCPFCGGLKELPVCAWCEEGAKHSHCDDSWTKPCEYCEDKEVVQ